MKPAANYLFWLLLAAAAVYFIGWGLDGLYETQYLNVR